MRDFRPIIRCRRDNFADDVVDEKISISDYSLSASVSAVCYKLRSISYFGIGCLWQGIFS